MRVLLAALLAACIALPASARTLTSPSADEVRLLRSWLAATPPDYASIAEGSDVVRTASEFDRADVAASEVERLRQAYLSMADVDRIVLRVQTKLSLYDGQASGYRIEAFEPGRYVGFRFDRVTFDNADEVAFWRLPEREARKILAAVGSDRIVEVEIEAIPVAASATDGLALRTQIRTVRVATRDGVTLGTLRSTEPDAVRVLPGVASGPSVSPDRLDLMGLRVGASYGDFRAWVAERGFEGATIHGDVLPRWRYELAFAAEPGVIPPPSDAPTPPRQDFWSPLPVVGGGFACDAKTAERRICGSVSFTPGQTVDDRTITSIRLAQTIGGSPDAAEATLVAKFGPPSDRFDVQLPTWNGDVEAKMVVWGFSRPVGDDTRGTVKLTNVEQTWPVEALVVPLSPGRTVLIVQVAAPPTATEAGPAAARL